jgi:cytochrome c5
MPGDNYEWNRRYKKGFDMLIKHTIDGYNRGVMPKRGGCRNCSEKELENAIVYMLNKSGVAIDTNDR